MNRLRSPLLRMASVLVLGLAATQAWAENPHATATVTFGAWMSSPPLDRFPNSSNTRLNNDHLVTPNVVKVKAGGTVNFIISGLHNIAVYEDGIEPEDIDISNPIPTTGPVPNPPIPIINDPNGRIYRGLDPTLQPIDRIEAVRFDEPGTYLVICGIVPHFTGGMYGYVVVQK